MATPNYGYEKRQRELAKKKKKEEKLRAKASGKRHDGTDAPDGDTADGQHPGTAQGEPSTGGEGSGSAA
ncbi:MAG: hypothetical protein C0453_20225 [Comamonadaceae bacterium]|nr:hypothetical protein [Comamonadaceae bacterium]